jgi:hypothetical protein
MHLTDHAHDVESAGPASAEIEVTEEMVDAGYDAALSNYWFLQDGIDERELKKALISVFRAMLASAPRAHS